MSLRDHLYQRRPEPSTSVRATAPGVEPGEPGFSAPFRRLVHLHGTELDASWREFLASSPTGAVEARLGQLLAGLRQRRDAADLPGFEIELERVLHQPRRFADAMRADASALGPLSPLLEDPDVTLIAVNGPDAIYYEKRGRHLFPHGFLDEDHLGRVLRTLQGHLLEKTSPAASVVQGHLANGSVVDLVFPPVSLTGPTLTLRRLPELRLTLASLVASEALDERMVTFLSACVRSRVNVVVCGAHAADNAAMLGALLEELPPQERVVLIDDGPRLDVQLGNLVHLHALPDGASTHLAGGGFPDTAINRLIGAAVHLVVQLERGADGASHVARIAALEAQQDGAMGFTDVFVWKPAASGAGGRHGATGLVPPFARRLEQSGVPIPPDLYQP